MSQKQNAAGANSASVTSVPSESGSGGNSGTDVDELFEVKTYFFIGAHQQCLNEINKLARVPSLEKDCFMWRAYIAQHKYRVVLDGIRDAPANGADALQAIRRLALYQAQPERRADVVQWFDEHQTTVLGADEPEAEDVAGHVQRVQWLCAAAGVYYNEGLFETAVKLLHGRSELECLALAVQSLLRMNRADLARQHYARMQTTDDDATLTQLASAWLGIEAGGDKLQDAYYIYQDLGDKFTPTATLLNGQAVCYLGQHKYEEAAVVLREALDRDANDYDTLVNSAVLAEHWGASAAAASLAGGADAAAASALGSEQQVQRLLSQIRDSHATSQLVVDIQRKESEFERLCGKYEPTATQLPAEPVA